MWPSMFRFGAVLCMAVAVKLMDDLLDGDVGGPRDHDLVSRHETRALGAGGAAAYALGLGMVAAALNTEWAVTLFLASYAVGMLDDPLRRLPSRLPAGVESFLAILIGVSAYGWRSAVASLACIVLIQALDDLVDYRSDLQAGRRNWAVATVKFEVTLIAMIWFVIGLSLDWARLVASLLAVWLVMFAAARVTRPLTGHNLPR